jgi:hypothetical protein
VNAHVETHRSPAAGHLAGRLVYRGLLAFALVVNVALIAYLVAVIVPKVISVELGSGTAVVPAVTPSPSPSATPENVMSAIGVTIPNDADCTGCHSAPGVTKARPDMAHPLVGWEDCTSCHSMTGLVKTAPGHTGILKDQCLHCHAVKADQSAAPVPHHSFNGTACTSCHGNQDIPQAPMPTDMAGKTNCWVCHGLSKDNMLGFTPAPTTGQNGTTASPKPAGSAAPTGSAAFPLLIGLH